MKKPAAFVFAMFILLAACKNQEKANTPATGIVKKNYFPVADFIKSEIHYVDSLPLAIIKYTIQNNQTDSAFIKTDEFNQLAQEFLPPVLSTPAFEKDYIENSFMDE